MSPSCCWAARAISRAARAESRRETASSWMMSLVRAATRALAAARSPPAWAARVAASLTSWASATIRLRPAEARRISPAWYRRAPSSRPSSSPPPCKRARSTSCTSRPAASDSSSISAACTCSPASGRDSPSTALAKSRTSSDRRSSSAPAASTWRNPSVLARSAWTPMPMTVSAVSAAALAACETPLSASVTRRTEVAASPVVLVKSDTVPSSPWAWWKSLLAVASNPSRRACSAATSASLFSTSCSLWRMHHLLLHHDDAPQQPEHDGRGVHDPQKGLAEVGRQQGGGRERPHQRDRGGGGELAHRLDGRPHQRESQADQGAVPVVAGVGSRHRVRPGPAPGLCSRGALHASGRPPQPLTALALPCAPRYEMCPMRPEPARAADAPLAALLPPPGATLAPDAVLDRFVVLGRLDRPHALPAPGGGHPRPAGREAPGPVHPHRLGQVAGRHLPPLPGHGRPASARSTPARSRRWSTRSSSTCAASSARTTWA